MNDFYKELCDEARALTEGETNLIANLANAAALMGQKLSGINWAGFYLMDAGTLVLGPFWGKPACIRIAPGRGVCGSAVQQDQVQRVEDVHLFAGHIACDSASASEIVVPLHCGARVAAVLDIDSPVKARFTKEDEEGLCALAKIFEECFENGKAGYSL